jgi:hypothetical protein
MSSNSILTEAGPLSHPTQHRIPIPSMPVKSNVSRCELRSSSFLWNSARSSYFVSMKSFPIRRLQPFSVVHLVRSCRVWQERVPDSESCFQRDWCLRRHRKTKKRARPARPQHEIRTRAGAADCASHRNTTERNSWGIAGIFCRVTCLIIGTIDPGEAARAFPVPAAEAGKSL